MIVINKKYDYVKAKKKEREGQRNGRREEQNGGEEMEGERD